MANSSQKMLTHENKLREQGYTWNNTKTSEQNKLHMKPQNYNPNLNNKFN
jgi:hypothetical protein